MKSAALYDPYLDTLGGGEKHILSILKVLGDEGYEINIFWDKNLQKEIENRFALKFTNKLNFLSNIFKAKNTLQTLQTLQTFDYFFYITDGSYFVSTAKKNFVFAMVPDRNLYQQSLLNKIKTLNYKFITNSKFTQGWLKKWSINSEVIYPYINQELIDLKVGTQKKENIILSVGRFYSHLHSKQQAKLINLFNKLKQENVLFKDFKLILAGGLKEEDKNYFAGLKKSVQNYQDIEFKVNLPYSDLQNLYKKSLIYIHLTGYGVDENKNPEMVEHLGITPLEAMASGCLTFCFNSGGPREIIEDENNGFLFNTEDELIKKISLALTKGQLQYKIKQNAKEFVKNNFSYELFKHRVKKIILY